MIQPSKLAKLSALLLGAIAALLTGCQTTAPVASAEIIEQASAKFDTIILREGDVVRITFPGASNLDDTQQIRRDGKLALKQVGDLQAAGKSLADLEKEVLKLYESQLVVKQVSVTMGSSAYPIFVIGAVLKPGKIMSDKPLSIFEAVMEAGGFDLQRANMKKVVVLRESPEGVTSFTLNLKDTLDGKNVKPFYLKPSDVVFVKQKFSWF